MRVVIKISEDRAIDLSKYFGLYVKDLDANPQYHSIYLQVLDRRSNRDLYLQEFISNNRDECIKVLNVILDAVKEGICFLDLTSN